MQTAIRGKAKERDGVVTAKILMTHPMESGLRKDKDTGKVIPAHFVEEILCTLNDETVYAAYLAGAISKNPYLSFKFKGPAKGQIIKAVWRDNQGGQGSADIEVR